MDRVFGSLAMCPGEGGKRKGEGRKGGRGEGGRGATQFIGIGHTVPSGSR